ncbi:MAG TPA: hypothetical protein ENJ09_09135 [Planctomycetes bacterium]|nr:hypothetical protein [Planctomycetota bacterium]
MSKTRFTWLWGVLGFGMSSAIAFAYVLSTAREESFFFWLALGTVTFAPGGYFWGRFMAGVLRVGEPAED